MTPERCEQIVRIAMQIIPNPHGNETYSDGYKLNAFAVLQRLLYPQKSEYRPSKTEDTDSQNEKENL